MSGCKFKIGLLVVLVFVFSNQAFSQLINDRDSVPGNNFRKEILKPRMVYSVGSTVMFVPHLGSVTAFTLSPSISLPLSPNLSINGGIIAGRIYPALWSSNPELAMNGAFSELSVYGSATYHVNPQLTLYGAGIKQLTSTSPFNSLPKSSYTLGSSYNFGSFSIGVSFQMSQWNNNFGTYPFNGSQGYYSPFELRPGIWY